MPAINSEVRVGRPDPGLVVEFRHAHQAAIGQRHRHVTGRKQSFQDTCVPKLELGNEGGTPRTGRATSTPASAMVALTGQSLRGGADRSRGRPDRRRYRYTRAVGKVISTFVPSGTCTPAGNLMVSFSTIALMLMGAKLAALRSRLKAGMGGSLRSSLPLVAPSP